MNERTLCERSELVRSPLVYVRPIHMRPDGASMVLGPFVEKKDHGQRRNTGKNGLNWVKQGAQSVVAGKDGTEWRQTLLFNKGNNFGSYFCEFFLRYNGLSLGLSASPIKTFHLISKNCADRIAGNKDFKRVPFYLGGNGTANHQTCFLVVGLGA